MAYSIGMIYKVILERTKYARVGTSSDNIYVYDSPSGTWCIFDKYLDYSGYGSRDF